MVRATLSNRRKKGTNHGENVNINKGKEHKHTQNMEHTMKALTSLDFKIPSFKKRANHNSPLHRHQNPTLSLNRKGLRKEINKLLEQNKTDLNINNIINSNESSILPFTKFYRNKPRQNYTNKSSHLSLTNLTKFKSKLIDDDDEIDIIDTTQKKEMNGYHSPLNTTKNNKKAKRAERRKKLKQQIADVTTQWKMDRDSNSEFKLNRNGNSNNHQNKSNHNHHHPLLMNDGNDINNNSLLDIDDIKESLKITEREIVKERKKITNNQRLIEADGKSLSALFRSNDLFNSNPAKFTQDLLRKRANALNMKSELESKQLPMNGVNAKHHKKRSHKMNGFHNHKNHQNKNEKKRNNHSNNHHHHRNQHQMNDEEIKEQITKELMLKKQKERTHRSQQKLKLSKNGKKDVKIRNGEHLNGKKPGKFIGKKLKKKMSESDKYNQKKRRWRA